MVVYLQSEDEEMVANHIHDALRQVGRLREFILEKRLFQGYSGLSRMGGAVIVMVATFILARPSFPCTPWAHLAGWSTVLVVGLLVYYGALIFWYLLGRKDNRPAVNIKPAVDAIPSLGVGAVLSLAVILRGEFDLLFGIWMCLYGLAHTGHRQSLPLANYLVGLFYLVSGGLVLFLDLKFTNPWPMGIVFAFGEATGGYIFYLNNHRPAVDGGDL